MDASKPVTHIADISYRLSIPSVVFAIVSPTVVALRIIGRMRITSQLGADDYAIMVSVVSPVAVDSLQLQLRVPGPIGHTSDVHHNSVSLSLCPS